MYQGPSGAPVAVGERVDGLELGVGDGGLGERRQHFAGREPAQVVQEPIHLLRRWRHEVSFARVVVVPADPVLFGSDLPADLGGGRAGHHGPVDVEDGLQADSFHAGGLFDGELHGVDVGQYLERGR